MTPDQLTDEQLLAELKKRGYVLNVNNTYERYIVYKLESIKAQIDKVALSSNEYTARDFIVKQTYLAAQKNALYCLLTGHDNEMILADIEAIDKERHERIKKMIKSRILTLSSNNQNHHS